MQVFYKPLVAVKNIKDLQEKLSCGLKNVVIAVENIENNVSLAEIRDLNLKVSSNGCELLVFVSDTEEAEVSVIKSKETEIVPLEAIEFVSDERLKDKSLWIYDVSNYLHRYYHAGITDIARAFLKNVRAALQMTEEHGGKLPDFILLAGDKGLSTYRQSFYPGYKNRDRDQESYEAVAKAYDIIDQSEFTVLTDDELEADDIIAAYAKAFPGDTTIMSTDKDLYQLLDERTKILHPFTNKFIDAETVLNKFGVEPGFICDMLSLAGDSADDIPGVPGIGPKKAAKILNKYWSLYAVLDINGDKKEKDVLKIQEFRDQALISRRLVQFYWKKSQSPDFNKIKRSSNV